MNTILIDTLRVSTLIGVPEEERAAPQELEVDLEIVAPTDFGDMADNVARTIDYAEVCRRVAELAAERPRRLLETLADEIARLVLGGFHASSVTVTIRKFILPETRWVGVRRSLCR